MDLETKPWVDWTRCRGERTVAAGTALNSDPPCNLGLGRPRVGLGWAGKWIVVVAHSPTQVRKQKQKEKGRFRLLGDIPFFNYYDYANQG